MMSSLNINKANSIAQAITGLETDDDEIKRIFRQCFSGTAKRMRSLIAKDLEELFQLPKKGVRRRVYYKYKVFAGDGEWDLWVGVNDIPLSYFGKLYQIGDDVRVPLKSGGYFEAKNAFVQTSGSDRKYTKAEKRKAGIDKSKRVYHQIEQPRVIYKDTLEEARYKVKREAIDHINRVIPYYFEKEFYRAFEGMLKQRYK